MFATCDGMGKLLNFFEASIGWISTFEVHFISEALSSLEVFSGCGNCDGIRFLMCSNLCMLAVLLINLMKINVF
jgi:hypothetical protein